MRVYTFVPIMLVLGLMISCASSPVTVQENLTAAELVQKAQEASERNRYEQAVTYYDAILTRFPEDLTMVCTAEYEIAFIRYKQKRYDDSKAGFRALLERYTATDAELLPAQYQILAEKVLAKMELEKK